MQIPNYIQSKSSKICNMACVLAVIDAWKNIIREENKDVTNLVHEIEKSLIKGSPWAGAIDYDMAYYARAQGFNVVIYKLENKIQTDPSKDIHSYAIGRRDEVLKLGVKEVITDDIERNVFSLVKEGKPVIVLVNGDVLYSKYARGGYEWWAHWIVLCDYDKSSDTFVIHDPAGWIIYKNPDIDLSKIKEIKELSGHYIKMDRAHLLKAWRLSRDVTARDLENPENKDTTNPFTQEALYIYPP